MLFELDTKIFLWLNGFHTPSIDRLMVWVSNKYTWIPLYVLILIWLVYTHRKFFWAHKHSLVLSVAMADILASKLFKPFFQRLRPCHNLDLEGLIHVVGDCGGKFGFASSHASTHFALATLLFLFFHKKRHFTYLWFVWAAVIAYSRIYLGVHYPLDILVGAGLGIGSAYLVFWSFNYFLNKKKENL